MQRETGQSERAAVQAQLTKDRVGVIVFAVVFRDEIVTAHVSTQIATAIEVGLIQVKVKGVKVSRKTIVSVSLAQRTITMPSDARRPTSERCALGSLFHFGEAEVGISGAVASRIGLVMQLPSATQCADRCLNSLECGSFAFAPSFSANASRCSLYSYTALITATAEHAAFFRYLPRCRVGGALPRPNANSANSAASQPATLQQSTPANLQGEQVKAESATSSAGTLHAKMTTEGGSVTTSQPTVIIASTQTGSDAPSDRLCSFSTPQQECVSYIQGTYDLP